MVLGMSLVRGFLASTGSQVIVLVDWWLSLMSLARHYEGLTPLSKGRHTEDIPSRVFSTRCCLSLAWAYHSTAKRVSLQPVTCGDLLSSLHMMRRLLCC
jgi:hypothetical protein